MWPVVVIAVLAVLTMVTLGVQKGRRSGTVITVQRGRRSGGRGPR
jgi:hypothetical protein